MNGSFVLCFRLSVEFRAIILLFLRIYYQRIVMFVHRQDFVVRYCSAFRFSCFGCLPLRTLDSKTVCSFLEECAFCFTRLVSSDDFLFSSLGLFVSSLLLTAASSLIQTLELKTVKLETTIGSLRKENEDIKGRYRSEDEVFSLG